MKVTIGAWGRLFLLPVVIAHAQRAVGDYLIWKDPFKQNEWRAGGQTSCATLTNGVLSIADDQRYRGPIALVSQTYTVPTPDYLPGTKLRFSVEVRGEHPVRLGLLAFPEAPRTEKPKVASSLPMEVSSAFERRSFEYVLEEAANRVYCTLQGKGEYRNVRLERIVSPACELRAEPAYQMVEGNPAPVSFCLFRDGKLVEDVRPVVDGLFAYEPETGATGRAYVDYRTNVSDFVEAAARVHLVKPVSILYLGDSLSHYDIGHNHVDRTGYFLERANPGNVSVYNYACGGDDIERVVQRMHGTAPGTWKHRYEDMWGRHYDWAFILLGHNDTKASSSDGYATARVPPSRQADLYRELISLLREKGVRRIVLISSTCSDFDTCKALAAKRSARVHNRFGDPRHQIAFNETLEKVASETGTEYLDVYTPTATASNRKSLFRPNDGVHLTELGHDLISLETLRYIGKEKQ